MIKTIRPLVAYLAEIPDPRKAQGLRHPLVAILCRCCGALMSGAKNPRAIANRWKRGGAGRYRLLKQILGESPAPLPRQ